MKKLVALMLCALLALPSLALAEEEKVLNILSWEGYVDSDTLAAFEEETGIDVVWSPMDSIDSMLLKVSEGGGADYDLIISSDYSLDILRKQGLIQKLDMSKLSNYGNLDPAFLSQTYDPDNEYVIPYMAGCPLIIYDPERVPFEITGYEDLWNPELADSVAVLENARVLCGITLKTMDKSMNETDPDVLAQMKEKLMPLYSNIRTFGDMESYSAVTTGEASVGFLFTPFVYMVQLDHPEFKVVYPKEGLGYGIDGLVIPTGAKHVDAAHQFLDYLMRPEVAANNAEMQYYMCVNQAAREYLSDTYREASVMNVPAELLKDAEFIEDVGATETLYQEIYTAFKNQ
ncbi:MAG TPA: spermidine/putrescine ABC transporter substrate-binding protein [Candidatus Limiplasma pullistercoris]|nr:spermidine/putrescine ABC transporter substrate-binding protein [Candidatus Limiplasma pullistercoris]